MNPQELIAHYEQLKKDCLRDNRTFEAATADVYLAVFNVCFRKYKKDKHFAYIRQQFGISDSKRLQFGDDEQDEDALQEALRQEAYRLFWIASGLPDVKSNLVKTKPFSKPYRHVPGHPDRPINEFRPVGLPPEFPRIR
jgi:hypothetical protein